MRSKQRSEKESSLCVKLLLALIVIVILIVWWNSSRSESYEMETPYTDNVMDKVMDKVIDKTNRTNFVASAEGTPFPYNYWYLTQYPLYLQSWKWGKGIPECINPDAYYPYYWPHNGRGWELTGYGRRQ